MDRPALLYKIDVAGERLGIGRTKLYELMASGELESVKIGRARLIPAAALDRFVQRLISDQR